MKDLIDMLMSEFRALDVAEVGIFKICMVSLGILLGFTAGRKRCKWVFPLTFLIFLATSIFMMIKFYGGEEEEIEE